MKKEYTILIPVCRNTDKKPIDPAIGQQFLDNLVKACGGYTIHPMAGGVWVADNGEVIRDQVLPVSVALEGDLAEAQSITLAQTAAVTFYQQAIYLRKPDGYVDLVYHPSPESVAYDPELANAEQAPPVLSPPDASELVGPNGELLAAPRRRNQ